MKKCLILIVFYLAANINAGAQGDGKYDLRFSDRTLTPFENNWSEVKKSIHKVQAQKKVGGSKFDIPQYVVVQFFKTPTKEQLQFLKNLGIQIFQYVDGKAYLARISEFAKLEELDKLLVRATFQIPSSVKRSRDVFELANGGKESAYLIHFAPGMTPKEIEDVVQKNNLQFVESSTINLGIVSVKGSTESIIHLSEQSCCIYIDRFREDEPLRYEAVTHSRSNQLTNPNLKNLSGTGIVVGVGDGGKVWEHKDFQGRLTNFASGNYSTHATWVAGIVSGYPNIQPLKGSGVAPEATLITNNFSDIIRRTPQYIADYDMVLTNNSYGSGLGNCTAFGDYNSNSALADEQMNIYPQLLHVFSAGNDGSRTCAPYDRGYATVAGGWQTSKNVLTVGSTSQSDVFSFFSSSGPVHDGRIKPEIVAQGSAVLTTREISNYSASSGTSFSGPAITGIAALLYERYRQLHGGLNPDGSLIKAMLCATADDFGIEGPDYYWGFGRVHAKHALDAMEQNDYIESTIVDGAANSHQIIVPSGAHQLKVMLLWTDPAGLPYTSYSLVNDLDMVVTDPLNETFLPWVLDPGIGQFNQPAVRGIDHVNNYEQVTIDLPTAGTYTIDINGFDIPMDAQAYKIVYQIVSPEIEITYPVNGESWASGGVEYIRWDSRETTNTFTLKYSLDNGSSWNTISDAIPSHRRIQSLLLPDTLSEQFIVTIQENTTSKSDTQDVALTLMHVPIGLTLENKCNTSATLSWAKTPGAISYKVYQLMEKKMEEISITSDTFFKVDDLPSNNDYWWSISAVLPSGKESVRAPAIHSGTLSGSCACPNDLAMVRMLSPISGRKFTTSALTSIEDITIEVVNNDIVDISNFEVGYQLNNDPIVTEMISGNISGGDTLTHTFAQTVDLSAIGSYELRTWVNYSNDDSNANDTLHSIVRHVRNAIVSLPHLIDFESLLDMNIDQSEFAISGLNGMDLELNGLRARSFAGSEFPANGNQALTLDASAYNVPGEGFAYFTLNFENIDTSNNDIRLNFNFRHHEFTLTDDSLDLIWIRGNDTSEWIQAYNLYENFAETGILTQEKLGVPITSLLKTNNQNFSPSFQLRLGNESKYMADELQVQDGITIDDLFFYEVTNDLKLTKVISPPTITCGDGQYSFIVEIENTSLVDFPNVVISCSLNDGSVTSETLLVPKDTVIRYTLDTIFTFIEPGIQLFDVWVHESTDTYRNNDSILNHQILFFEQIDSFPYLQTFESSNGGYITGGKNSSWSWGTPQSVNIQGAAEGTKAWCTNLTGAYNRNEDSFLFSPCFHVGSMTRPALSFAHRYLLENDYDYGWVEYSPDGGISWDKLGNVGEGLEWYNDVNSNAWDAANKYWISTKFDIPTAVDSVQFRWRLSSDGGLEIEGMAIDQVMVYDQNDIYTGVDIDTTFNVSTSDWNEVLIEDQKLISINTSGQSIGEITLSTYFFSDSVRNNNSSYLLGRNWVIRTENEPMDSIGLRLYISAEEADALLAESNCEKCILNDDAFELAVLKYSGPNEDGNWENNDESAIENYQDNEIHWVPEANGYYAEIWVHSFSEFWIGSVPLNTTDTICVVLSGNTNDAEETVGTGSMNPYHESLRLGEIGFARQIGLKFENVGVPTGSIIESAFLQFTAASINTTPTSLNISAFSDVNIGSFTTYNYNISSRSSYPSSKNWIVAAWNTIDESGLSQRSPNIKNQIQASINNEFWRAGNSLGLSISGTGSREGYSFDGSKEKATKLIIAYTDSCAVGNRLYVDVIASGTNEGDSWANAINNLNDALTIANACSEVSEIWVKQGTYKSSAIGDPRHTLEIQRRIKIFGGFDGTESTPEDRDLMSSISVLDGEGGQLNDSLDNALHIITTNILSDTILIDGFHISNGYAQEDGFFDSIGGAISNSTILHVRNCMFEGNNANDGGTSILNYGANSLLIIEDCTFSSQENKSAIWNRFDGSIEWLGSNFILNQ